MKFPYVSAFGGILTGIAFLQGAQATPANSATYQGQAADLKSHAPVYREVYQEGLPGYPAQTETRYLDLKGTLFARRVLDFSGSDCKPDYVLKDLRDGYEEGAAKSGNQIRVFTRANFQSPMKEKKLNVPEPCVIDGGFNNFLKKNWDVLASGKTVSFNFIAPSQLDYFAFRAREDFKSEAAGKHEKVFFIELDNALLRLLVKPILVTYDSETRRLIRYQGLSNINGPDGKSLKVKLVYPEGGP